MERLAGWRPDARHAKAEGLMKSSTGVIVVVQEGRFRLIGDDGRPRHFVLSHRAPLEPQDLPPLQRAQSRVTVRYRESDRLIAGIVHDIDLESDQPPTGHAS
jgi:hypothetical protein